MFFPAMILMTCLASADGEVPDWEIRPDRNRYKDYEFQVLFEQDNLRHSQWKSYRLVVCVSSTKRRVVNRNGYIEIWSGDNFVYSSSLPETTIDQIPDGLRRRIHIKEPLLFSFRVNLQLADKSWFNYQVCRDDGSVEVNCRIQLIEFVKDAVGGDVIQGSLRTEKKDNDSGQGKEKEEKVTPTKGKREEQR